MDINTDTVTLRRILGECHLTCNKEAEIAVLTTEMSDVKDAIKTFGTKLDVIEKHIVKSDAEKNMIMAVIGVVGGVIGTVFGGKS